MVNTNKGDHEAPGARSADRFRVGELMVSSMEMQAAARGVATLVVLRAMLRWCQRGWRAMRIRMGGSPDVPGKPQGCS